MAQRMFRPLAWLVLVSVLLGSLPLAAPVAAKTQAAPGFARAPHAAIALPPDTPQPVASVAAALRPALPALAIELAVDPDPVSIGDTAILSVTITNRAPYPGDQIRVTIPAPAGVLAVPGPGATPNRGWAWDVGHLDAGAAITLVGELRVTGQIGGGAFVLRAEATAAGITTPFTAAGGALVRDPALGPASVPFTPSKPATLRSSDGRVTVTVPGTASDRPLTLRADRSHGSAPDRVHGRPTTGAIALSATDEQGGDVHTFNAPLTIQVAYTPEELQAQNLSEATLSLFWVDATTGE